MGFPSCGRRGRCHGEWGSFSCQCVTGYTGQQCEKGKDFCLLVFGLLLRGDIRFYWLLPTLGENHPAGPQRQLTTAVRTIQSLKASFASVYSSWNATTLRQSSRNGSSMEHLKRCLFDRWPLKTGQKTFLFVNVESSKYRKMPAAFSYSDLIGSKTAVKVFKTLKIKSSAAALRTNQ